MPLKDLQPDTFILSTLLTLLSFLKSLSYEWHIRQFNLALT